MAAGTVTLYAKNKANFRLNDLIGATVKLALVGSGYSPDASVTGHSVWADVSANEIAAVGGYIAQGKALASMVATAIAGGYKFSSSDVAWAATGADIPAHRYGVILVIGTLWGMTNPVIGYFVVDTTPADKPPTTNGNTLTHSCPAQGWFDIT
ncbi:hypothetical protein ACFJGW_00505 [Burkholderiaceae bacterium UC74_6]